LALALAVAVARGKLSAHLPLLLLLLLLVCRQPGDVRLWARIGGLHVVQVFALVLF